MNKPEIIIPEQPKIHVRIGYKYDVNTTIKKEKEELNEMKKVRAETGLSLGKLIELRKKGYKLIKIRDKYECY